MIGAATLRYGVVAVGGRLRTWQLACIEKLEESGLARLQCLVTCAPEQGADRKRASMASYDAFSRSMDLPSQAFAQTPDEQQLFERVLRIETPAALTGKEEIEKIRMLGLDFVLLFGSKAHALKLGQVAGYGVWYFVHSDISRFASPAPCFWEIYHDHDVTGAALLRFSDAGSAGVVLKSGYFATISDSFRQNIESAFASLPNWPVQVCRELHDGIASYINDVPIADAPTQLPAPSARHVLVFRARQAMNRIASFALERLFLIDWNIGRLTQPASAFIGREERAVVSRLRPYVRGAFIADPCAFRANDTTYVFCELYRYATDRGIVAVGELDGDRGLQVQAAIEEPFHLSYPQVFEHQGIIYCMPESAQAGNVCLYQAIEFPHAWRRAHVLLEGFAAVDSTLVWFDDLWWLFCTNAADGFKGSNSHLHVWYASDLLGKWTPHPRNPVKIDARSARPAGQFIRHEGNLYRPAQNCSRTYGGSIAINRVDRLTKTEYRERVVGSILPPAGIYNKGLHTISAAGGCYVVDVKRYVFEPKAVIGVFKMAIKSVALALGVPEQRIQSLKQRLKR